VFLKEALHGFTGMVPGVIMDQDDMLSCLLHHMQQELLIAFTVEASCEVVYQPKHLVCLAFPTGRRYWLSGGEREQ